MSTGKDAVTYQRQQRSRRDYQEARQEIQEAIKHCSRAIENAGPKDYAYVASRLVEDIIPAMERVTSRDLQNYGEVCGGKENWSGKDFESFLRNRQAHVDRLRAAANSREKSDRSTSISKRIVSGSLASLTCIAENENILLDEYKGKADVVGGSTKLGEHLQDEEMDLGDPIASFAEDETGFKTLHCGRTNAGKSTGLESEVWDFYQQNFDDTKNEYKVIDLVGFRQGENWTLDVPQQQQPLRRIRDEMGLDEDYVEAGHEEPKMEVLIPLTQGLSSKELPFDTESEEFVPRPFTVPPSEIRKPILVALIDSRLSESEENTFRNVYDEVARSKTDWSLGDIADEIRDREDLSDKHKNEAIGVLRSLQDEGFIRPRSAPGETLEWREIFTDTETITVFSQALCETKLAKLITFAYLIDAIVNSRQQMANIPQCVLVMREMWEVAPHKRRQEPDKRAEAVQDAMAQIMVQLMRQNRHIGAHLFGDTQAPSDLLKAIRERFNRYVVYSADFDTIKDIFSWTYNNKYKSFARTVSPRPGEAGIVGQVQPAVEKKDIEYISPVRMAPPPHHHFDATSDQTGWHARVKYHDDEVLRRPAEVDGVEWDDEIPDELDIEMHGKEDEENESADPSVRPIVAFWEECLDRDPAARVRKARVQEAYNNFAQLHGHEPIDFDDHGALSSWGSKLTSAIPGPVKSTQISGDTAYQELKLTPSGESYVNDVEVESAAAPVGDD